MFDLTLETKITAVVPSVNLAEDNPRRFCRMTMVFDFDDDLASGIGEVAVDTLKHMRAGTMTGSPKVPFDAVKCQLRLDAGGGSKHEIKKAVGVSAVISKANKEEASPTLTLKIDFPTITKEPADLLWVIDHLASTVDVTIKRIQEDLKGVK